MLLSWGPAVCWDHMDWVTCAATWGHEDVWARAVNKGHVRVHGPLTAGVCVDVHSPCCHWEPLRCLWSWLLLDAIQMSGAPAVNRGQIDLSVLCCLLYSWWCSGPGYCWGTCLGPRTYCSLSLCWCPWPELPPKVTQYSMVCAATWSHRSIQDQLLLSTMFGSVALHCWGLCW